MNKSKAQKLFNFDNSYFQLPAEFYRRALPMPVNGPCLMACNHTLASELGLPLDGMDEALCADIFAGNHLPHGAEPIAMAYAGHQFGHFVPQLGDGRAILLGEVLDRHGIRRDIQLKGCGRTFFSRSGDGRAALGPVIREYILSEAMHALGIRTTRALAAVTTGEPVYRETILPGAILTRVALSLIRIGTFEYFAGQGNRQAVQRLADYAIDRLYPDARSAANPYAALLQQVIDAQAALVASWMNIGFIHGVMNTDNMALSGETIDYGPCAFLDHYDPLKVFSSIDRYGRYAFGNQPRIAQWNLARFAETLLPLLASPADEALQVAEQLIAAFSDRFEQYWLAGVRKKLGLLTQEETDAALAQDFLALMHRSGADYTLCFRLLCDAANPKSDDVVLNRIFQNSADFKHWLARWHERLARQSQASAICTSAMRLANPAYIPRNHRIQQAIEAGVERGDFSVMKQLLEVFSHPYREREDFAEYALPPTPLEQIRETFCGT